MGSVTESILISKLQSTDLTDIYNLFSDYLGPFTAVLNCSISVAKVKKPAKKFDDSEKQSTIRSLAKQFLPFLNRTLSIIPKRLCEIPKISEQSAISLFDTYRHCLDCLDSISSQLACKPYSVHAQRVRLIHCLETWGRYKEAEVEVFSVLESIRTVETGGLGLQSTKSNGMFLPVLTEESADQELALLLVEIVVTFVKCVSMSQSKDESEYRRVLILVAEVNLWFRVLDANAGEKLQKVLLLYLNKCALFLIEEGWFGGNLACSFCQAAFDEYAKSAVKDQVQKFARRLCSTIFLQAENQSAFAVDVLSCVLNNMASACKVGAEDTAMEFLELVCYCANKCRAAKPNVCGAVAACLNKIAGDSHQVLSPFDLIIRIYASGLFISELLGQSGCGDDSQEFRNGKDLSVIGDILKCHFNVGGEMKSLPFSVKWKNSVRQHFEDKYSGSTLGTQNGMLYLVSWCNALQVLCQPLADFVNSERKEIVVATNCSSFSTNLCIIQDALNRFCNAFCLFRSESGREVTDTFGHLNKTALCVAVAAFTLSFRTKCGIEERVTFIEDIISANWIEAHGLKYLFASLFNIGVILYRNKQMEEASRALRLCYRASWTCVSLFCDMLGKSDKFHGEVAGGSVVGFVTEVCEKSAFTVDVLYQCGSSDVNSIIQDSLESWSVAEDLFTMLPSPISLVKQWVKIECKRCLSSGKQSGTTLYSLLSSSVNLSKMTIAILLEQELLAYTEMTALYPRLCQRMQMDIIDILLEKVYITEDTHLSKSKVLITKGRVLRASGTEGLHECIKCLSQAISTMKEIYKGTSSCNVRHQLACTYCLRALCIQEAEPKSKELLNDIRGALHLWLSPDHCHETDQCDVMSQNMLVLLYHVIDLLILKGYMKFHSDIYEMMIKFIKLKGQDGLENILKKFIAMLWECRRLGHTFCSSSVDETFIVILGQHFGLTIDSDDFWISCMKESQALQLGFQQDFFPLFPLSSKGSHHHRSSFWTKVTVDKVKQAASDLISNSPLRSSSVLAAAFLYYDLCERLIHCGRLIEALPYAKKAHRLCSKLLQEHFLYTVELQDEICNENGEVVQKRCYNIKTFQISTRVVTKPWLCDEISCNLDNSLLTPWNVLQSYLACTLQVGNVHEIIGNASEAETLLLWGKNIACYQGLPLFVVAFSTMLGKLYRKQELWNLAEHEIQIAKQTLDNCNESCLKCKLVLDIGVHQQLGDISRNRFDNIMGRSSFERLFYAEKIYESAIDKLNLYQWRDSVGNHKEACGVNSLVSDAAVKEVGTLLNINSFPSGNNEVDAQIKTKRSTRSKIASKPLSVGNILMGEENTRMTRSRYRSLQKQNQSIRGDEYSGPTKGLSDKDILDCVNTLQQRGPRHVNNDFISECKIACACSRMKNWHVFPRDIIQSRCVHTCGQIKWEVVCRRLFLRLLISKGKCLGVRDEIHEAHDVLMQSISVLTCGNPLRPTNYSVPHSSLFDLIEEDVSGDLLALEHAEILYYISWFALKVYPCKESSLVCCEFSHIKIPRIVSWLTQAFILSREVPILFQKVSKLLAALYTVSTVVQEFSLSPCKPLSASQWAAFFHQASLGTHLSQQQVSSLLGEQKVQSPIDCEGPCLSGSNSDISEASNSLRFVPESVRDLEAFIINFFQGLPHTTVICISLLGGPYSNLLRELLRSSPVDAWILLSRLNSNDQPFVILLPANSIAEENTEAYSSTEVLHEMKGLVKQWHCPWGFTVVDDVAPVFRALLEENYFSSSGSTLEDTKETRSLWWKRRMMLDQRLGEFLRNLEDSWFGHWKYLLLGEWSDCKHLELVQKKLVSELKFKYKVDVHEYLLKLIIGGAKYACENQECILPLILSKGCYVGGSFYGGYDLSSLESISQAILKQLHKTAQQMEDTEIVNKRPIILVLDLEVQMLPWENLPILRNQEVYRMPSVGSISARLERCYHPPEQVGRNSTVFPLIDPQDAYYVLNPSGDLIDTQMEFENWFRDQNFEGKTGTAPTVDELTTALRNHDLFIYFGHGSGEKYFSANEIQKLETCAATLLMGCSSGSLSLNGSYIPKGAPLYYLSAGSPVVVANLWEVTDKDIDRFGKAMLDAWLRERSSTSSSCAACSSISDELKSLNIDGGSSRVNRKKRVLKEESHEFGDAGFLIGCCCSHRPKIGSFMRQAREACKLPFLIGASPVCYGVPTGIKRKQAL